MLASSQNRIWPKRKKKSTGFLATANCWPSAVSVLRVVGCADFAAFCGAVLMETCSAWLTNNMWLVLCRSPKSATKTAKKIKRVKPQLTGRLVGVCVAFATLLPIGLANWNMNNASFNCLLTISIEVILIGGLHRSQTLKRCHRKGQWKQLSKDLDNKLASQSQRQTNRQPDIEAYLTIYHITVINTNCSIRVFLNAANYTIYTLSEITVQSSLKVYCLWVS